VRNFEAGLTACEAGLAGLEACLAWTTDAFSGRPGWVTFGTFAQFNNPIQIPGAPRSNTPAHFHAAGAAAGYWIGHRGTN